tara:strand:+ start:68 stop:271 length:204 start_codon:yes stop_codon:yes gene_type:complete
MKNKNIEKLIIKKATELAKNDFASGYDPDCKLYIADAICYLISKQLTDCEKLDTAELYDFLITKLKK